MTLGFNPSYAPMAKATQYAAPDISKLLYEGIGNLPQDYYQGQQNAQQLAMQRMFPNGLTPYIDPQTGFLKPGAYADIANKAAQTGGLSAVTPMLNNLINMQNAQGNAAAIGAAGAAAGYAGGYQQPGYAPPQTAGPQSNTLPGRAPGPQSAAPAAQPREPSGEMDNLAGLGTEMYGSSRDASRAIGQVAREMRVRPSDTLTPEQISDARDLLGSPRIAALVPSSARSRADTDPASGPQPTFGQSEDVVNVPRSTSATERGVNGTPGPAPDVSQPVGGAGPGAITPAGIQPNSVQAQRIRIPGPPPAQLAPQQRVAQGLQQIDPLTAPAGYGPDRANLLRGIANKLEQRAAITGGGPGDQGKSMAQELLNTAKSYRDQADLIDKAYLERTQPTGTMKEALTPGAPGAIAGLEGRKKFATERNEQFAKTAQQVNAMALRAQGDIDHLRDGSNLVDFDPNFYSGPLHQFAHAAYQGEWLLGGPRTANTANEMAAKEIANNELSVIKDLGDSNLGRILMREVATAQKTIMSMGQTPETVRKLFELGIRLREHMLATKQILDQHNGYADDKFTTDVIKYYQQNPLITPQEMEDPRLLAPPKIRYENDFGRLNVRKGDPFRYKADDGTWRIKIYPGPKQQQSQ